jgi:hypothetical protein
MSRFVVPSRPGLVAGEGEPPDGLTGRIVKYVPAEILSIFAMAIGGVASYKPAPEIAWLIAAVLIVVFCIGTWAYMTFRAPEGNVRKAQQIVSPLAFLAWSYVISSPLLGSAFIGWVALIAQAIILLLALIIAPTGRKDVN